MKKIGMCGHFATVYDCVDGQTIKTKNIYYELKKSFDDVEIVDTHNWKHNLFKLLLECFKLANNCKNIIVSPAHNGIKVFIPLFVVLQKLNCFKLHYIVIGGWLPEFLNYHKWLLYFLKKTDYIYVETSKMRLELNALGLTNISIVHNFKNIKPENLDQYIKPDKQFKFCTFSRVMQEKGVEDAIKAIEMVNDDVHIYCSLDIYGPIEENYKDRFLKIMAEKHSHVKYGGVVESNQSVMILKKYFALLFPTYYEGEGMAGTIIDAYAAGLPVIASDWKYNTEIVNNGVTGYIFRTHDIKNLKETIIKLIRCQEVETMKNNCIQEAKKYLPQNAIKSLLRNLK
jgi:glycosyltransferase involved in cell wall biosynthesis